MNNLLYTRVSTKEQGETSLNMQTQLCLSYLSKKGITLNNFYKEISSAYNGKQPILNELLDTNNDSTLYVLNVSRFSRNIVNGCSLLEKAKNNNIKIIFIEEDLDSTKISNLHMLRTKISESQYESDVLSNRLTSRNKLKRSRGWEFGTPEYGKKAKLNINDIRKIVLSKEEQFVIDFIVEARNGCSCKKLNNRLKKINKKADPINFYDSDGVTKINYFDKSNTLTYQEIADLLNDYDISKRGKEWTSSSVSRTFNQYNENNSVNSLSTKVNSVII